MILIKLVALIALLAQGALLLVLVWTPETDQNAVRLLNRIRGKGGRQQ